MNTSQGLTDLFGESEPSEQESENGRIRINRTLTIVDQKGVKAIFHR